MPRPNDEERRRIQDRRDKNQKARDHEAERNAAVRKRVEGLLDNALDRRKALVTLAPDVLELATRLEEHRMIALTCYPPQVKAANESVFMTARLLGLVVDQQAVLTANVSTENMP